MLDRFSPYTLIGQPNPVFRQDQQHLGYLKTPRELRLYNRLAWQIIPAAILLWWLLERLGYGFGVVPAEFENRLVLAVLYLSLGLMLLSSAYTVAAVVGPLNRLFHLGQWPLLRVTCQPEAEILKAKDAIAQLRVWMFFALEMGLRAAVVTLFFLNILYGRYHTVSLASFIFFTIINPLCWGVYSFIFVTGIAFILEPIYRMKVLVALCTAAAIQIRQPSLALLGGMAGVLFIHLVQAGLVGSLAYLYQYALQRANDETGVLIMFSLLPLSLFAIAAGHFIYTKVRKLTLWFIYRNGASLL